MIYAHINGALIEEAHATVSVNDRGFRFGDGVFETIPVSNAMPYLWEYHEKRLIGGLESLKIPYNTQTLLAHALALISANKVSEGILRIQISRGSGSKGYLPSSSNPTPTLVMQTQKRPEPVETAILWLSAYEKISPRSLPTHYKLAQGLSSTLARMEASEHQCHDALQLAEGGMVSEASSANIFWRKDRVLYTPSLACGALAGVTRQRLIEIAPYRLQEGKYLLDDLIKADAVILTNASYGATAINALLPKNVHWDSSALAQEINALRNKDIEEYTSQLRESLART
jgi:branched-chain amino acid aminotransferase